MPGAICKILRHSCKLSPDLPGTFTKHINESGLRWPTYLQVGGGIYTLRFTDDSTLTDEKLSLSDTFIK